MRTKTLRQIYTITEDGRVFNSSGKEMNQTVGANGYINVKTTVNKVQKTNYIHREVALAFVDGYFEGAHVDHIDRDRHNNHYTNLRWVTRRENQRNMKSSNSSGDHNIRVHNNKNGTKGYRVIYEVNKKKITVGTYRTIEEARVERDRHFEANGIK